MLASIRAFSKSWVAIILFMLLLVSLIIWGGMGDMLKNQVTNGVISVGKHSMSARQYEAAFNRQLESLAQQNGGKPVPREEATKAGYHIRMLQALADQLSFAEALNKLGLAPSPTQFAEKLQGFQAFFDPVTGKFDEKQYKALLAQNGVTVDEFKQSVSDGIAADHFAAGLQAGLVAPRAYGTLVAVSQLENRSWSSFTIDPSKVAKPAPPTDAQLQAFINEFGQKKPETRDISFVRFSAKAIEDQMPVDPAELQKLYDFRKDTMSKPEMRSLVQIPVKTAAQAAEVAKRLGAGEDPAAIAKSVGSNVVTYVDKPKTAVTDRKIADAAFALQSGQVSGAIQGDLGMAVVKVEDVKPALVVGFEQAKPELEKQLKHDAAQKKVYEQVEAYEKAHDTGAKMADAAKTVGATVVTFGPIAANGATQTQPPPGLTQRLAAQAFELAQGEESDTQDEGNGEYFVVQVNKVYPSAMPQLAEVRPQVTEAYMRLETQKALKAKADELLARIKKGETLEAVAQSIGAQVDHAVSIDKPAAQQQAQKLGVELLTAVFSNAKGEVVEAGAPNGLALVRVDDVKSGPLDQLAPIAETSRRQANGAIMSDMAEGAQTYARAAMKPTVNVKQVNKLLGVADEPAKKTDAAPKKAKG